MSQPGRSLFLLLLLLGFAKVYALESDKEQTMHLVADTADLSQKDRKGIYAGHVEFTQGSSNLRAAKATTEVNATNQLILAIAHGNEEEQAHYWTTPQPNQPIFHAYADLIKYYPLKHWIELIGHARIEQGRNRMSADKISYDILKQHLITQSQSSARTTLIYYPEEKSEIKL